MGWFHRLAEFLASAQFFLGLLWVGLTMLTVTLLILMRTRWGQSQPLRKCLLLSILAHVLLAGYATTVRIVAGVPDRSGEPMMRVSLTETGPLPDVMEEQTAPARKPWETPEDEPIVQSELDDASRVEADVASAPERAPTEVKTTLPPDMPLRDVPLADAAEPDAVAPSDLPRRRQTSPIKSAEPLKAPAAQRREESPTEVPVESLPDLRDTKTKPEEPTRTARPAVPSELLKPAAVLPRLKQPDHTAESGDSLVGLVDLPSRTPRGKPVPAPVPTSNQADTGPGPDAPDGSSRRPSLDSLAGKRSPEDSQLAMVPLVRVGPPRVAMNRPDQIEHEAPKIYQLRTHPQRRQQAERYGATPESEAAVQAGLKWLARNQEPDGSWNPRHHEGGRETNVAGRDRLGAGIKADSGMTGLALLAFLAAGHTHQAGPYQANVQKGIDYLIKVQKPDGSLAGEATPFAVMYCHAMATFALSEAYALSGDSRLDRPVRRAVDFIVDAQDPRGGGWRYEPRKPGDTSQFGWQLMALKSAQLAGVTVPAETWDAARRYLNSVSSGPHGAWGAYRPGDQPSRPMTAEALVCRQFLGLAPYDPAATTAGDLLLAEPPGVGADNLYYWYYGTLGLHQLGGAHWDRWNRALQQTLLARQHSTGPEAGSWPPTTTWGSYGGRVYTTALSTLCLEVYYRYLPLYTETARKPTVLR
ncbi:MAG: hypothetical protein JW818_13655 [Pirellulales bacterium]|nr:hypothetical protein [Pirellulales bacterium]